MADHHLLVTEPDSPEQAGLESGVVLKVVQTHLNEPLFCKPLIRFLLDKWPVQEKTGE